MIFFFEKFVIQVMADQVIFKGGGDRYSYHLLHERSLIEVCCIFVICIGHIRVSKGTLHIFCD